MSSHTLQYEGFVDCGEVKKQYGIGPLQPMMLFCGRLVQQKGPDILLEAMPDILGARGDAVCVFVGDGHMRYVRIPIAHACTCVHERN
jgi:glycogen(starch) synthase